MKFEVFNFKGQRAIVRVDFNVPLNEQREITDPTRIDAAVPTIKKILNDSGSVILMSHLGRPKKSFDEKLSLKPVVPYLSAVLNMPVKFADDCMGEATKNMATTLLSGEVLLLENLRFYAEEEGKPRGLPEDASDEEKSAAKKAIKEKQKAFAQQLANYADVYVNDAFGTAHRAHASTALIADFFDTQHKMFGYIMANEISSLQKVLQNPTHPSLFIVGGVKVSDKIGALEHLIDKVDAIIIGGGMQYTFIKAMGGNIGSSLCEDEALDIAKNTIEKAAAAGVKLHFAADALVADRFANDAECKECNSYNIPEGWMGLDIGTQAIKDFSEVIENSKTILWNGPMGVFEMSSFEKGTKAIAEAIARATKKGAYSIIGGGDSIAAVVKYKLKDDISCVSTGGGAMIEYIEGKVLPGVAAIG
ncbi:MAG: phosphoglycerate kinase [Bacteroidales bacterium]|nr:phosphoglycerate kinase [Bacteroidales bacterium]